MSKDDENRKRNSSLLRAFVDSTIKKSDRKIKKAEKEHIRYVKSANPNYMPNEMIVKLISSAKGRILEKIPFEDSTHQFKIEIRGAYLPILREAEPLIRISTKPFDAPSYAFRPRPN